MRKLVLLLLASGVAVSGYLFLRHERPSEASTEPGEGANGPQRAVQVASALLSRPVAVSQGTLSITGRVTRDGAAVEGVTVVATRPAADSILASLSCPCEGEVVARFSRSRDACACAASLRHDAEAEAAQRDGEQPFARASTDSSGAFKLDGLESGAYVLWAEGHDEGAVRAGVTAGGTADLELEPLANLRGRVVDDRGHPIVGAQVVALFRRAPRVYEVQSGAQGAFTLRMLRGAYTLVGRSDGHVADQGRANLLGGQDDVELRLAVPIGVHGIVLRDRAPVQGAKVWIEDGPTSTSGADGRFTLPNVPHSRWIQVHASAAGATGAATVNGDNPASDARIALAKVFPVEVQVLDDDGRGISGARVMMRGGDDSDSHDKGGSTTDSAGKVTLAVPAGSYLPTATAKGWRMEHDADRQGRIFEVKEGGLASAVLKMSRAAALSGVVLDARGKPIPMARVTAATARAGDGPGDFDYANATTDEEGKFELELTPGAYKLSASESQHTSTELEARAPQAEVKITLGEGSTLRGRVLNAEGAPLAEAHVAAMPDDSLGAGRASNREPHETTCASDGTFELHGLSDGKFLLVAGANLGAGARRVSGGQITSAPVSVPTGEVVELRMRAGAKLSGKVVDGAGQPVADADVTAEPVKPMERPDFKDLRDVSRMLSRLPRSTTSAADGSFAFEGLDDLDYDLSAANGEGAVARPDPSARLRAHAGAKGVLLTVRAPAKVHGRLLGPDGAPLHDFAVNGQPMHSGDGRFSVDQEPFAKGELSFSADGLVTTTRTVATQAGVDADVGDVQLTGGRQVHGTVVASADNSPVSGASVTLGLSARSLAMMDGQTAGAPPAATSDADGHFTIGPLDDQASKLNVTAAGFAPAAVDVPSGSAEVQVALDRGGTLVVRGMDAQGNPIKGYGQASLADSAPGAARLPLTRRNASDAAAAETTYDQVPPGRYRVQFFPMDHGVGGLGGGAFWLKPREVEVVSGQTATVEFKQTAGGTKLVVQLTGPEGRPVMGMPVLVPGDSQPPTSMAAWRDLRRGGIMSARDENGSYFDGVPAGHYTLIVLVPEGRSMGSMAKPIDVSGDGTQTVAVTLDANLPTFSLTPGP